MSINYSERIPNNVDLATDRTLQRALEHWQPHFLGWWRDMGPHDFAANEVYLRTAAKSCGPMSRHQSRKCGCQCSSARCKVRSVARSTLFGMRSL